MTQVASSMNDHDQSKELRQTEVTVTMDPKHMRKHQTQKQMIRIGSNDSSMEVTERTLPNLRQDQSAIVIESQEGDYDAPLLPN